MSRLRIVAGRLAPAPLGDRGIALPLALLGLLAVTLLVTTVLLTSGTEFAVSASQRDADRSLYNANAALESYVARQGASAAANKYVEGTDVSAFGGTNYNMSLARLVRTVTLNPSGASSLETWSVTAVPAARGRGVGALIRVNRTLSNGRISVNAGFTSGGNVSIGGSSEVSNGTTGQVGCDSAAAPYSVEVSAGSSVSAGSNNLEGTTHVSTTTKQNLMTSVLGVPLDTLAMNAQIKFGPMFKCPGFTNQVCPEWPNNVRPNDDNSLTTADSVFNWGCPAADVGLSNCHGGQDRFVVVGIDARNIGSVKLNGDWGQGILMVMHGSLEIQGNFIFRGIILVDQDLKVTGTQGRFDGKLEGTVVAFGENSQVTDDVRGNAVIRYNRCSVNDAQNALNRNRIDQMPQNLQQATFAWYELVR